MEKSDQSTNKTKEDSKKQKKQKYTKIKDVGGGGQAVAALVKSNDDDSLAVIKQIDLSLMEDEAARREAYREAKILEVLKNPNVVRFREVFVTNNNKLCIVMDYAH
jgi:serine/threonine protein kinase